MIILDSRAVRFNYRVAGVCLHGRHALLQRADRDDFWSLPGGHPEAGEPSRETLAREWREEIGEEVRVGRLLWVVENFFKVSGRDHHDLGLYYEVALPDDSRHLDPHREFNGPSGVGYTLVFRWFPLDEIGEVRLYPAFLRAMLPNPPASPMHVVQTGDRWVLPSA